MEVQPRRLPSLSSAAAGAVGVSLLPPEIPSPLRRVSVTRLPWRPWELRTPAEAAVKRKPSSRCQGRGERGRGLRRREPLCPRVWHGRSPLSTLPSATGHPRVVGALPTWGPVPNGCHPRRRQQQGDPSLGTEVAVLLLPARRGPCPAQPWQSDFGSGCLPGSVPGAARAAGETERGLVPTGVPKHRRSLLLLQLPAGWDGRTGGVPRSPSPSGKGAVGDRESWWVSPAPSGTSPGSPTELRARPDGATGSSARVSPGMSWVWARKA